MTHVTAHRWSLSGWRSACNGLLVLLVACVALAACGDGGGTTAPPITIQLAPNSPSVADGDSAVLAVVATGATPLTYQWFRDGVAIEGATNPVYVTPVLAAADSGAKFTVAVGNALGTVTTAPGTVSVKVVPPTVDAQPQAQTVAAGQSPTFSVIARGSQPLAYQWQRDGIDISGANAASYSPGPVNVVDSGANFQVAVRNPAGQVTSAPAALIVSRGGPVVTAILQIGVASAGQSLVISSTLAGNPPFTYQWWRNGQAVAAGSGTTSDPAIRLGTGPLTAADDGVRYALTVSNADGSTRSPDSVISVLAAPKVAAGGAHSLARSTNGAKVWAWGDNQYGQLGLGSTSATATPVVVGGLSGVKAIAAGADHSLALMDDGTVRAWGRNVAGALGDGTRTDRAAPQVVAGLNGVIAVAAGAGRSYALRSDGRLWAWGENATGALGIGSQVDALVPTAVGQGITGFSNIVAVAAGTRHAVALRSDGRVFAVGQIGAQPALVSPALVDGLTLISGIGAGDGFSTAVDINGKMWSWGSNDAGRLGVGDTAPHATPMSIVRNSASATLLPTLGLSCGVDFALARALDGSVYAWGASSSGQLGTGEPVSGSTAPRIVAALPSPMVSIASGRSHSLAVRTDGTVYAWGANASGQLGIGSTELRRALPVQIPGLDLD